MDNAIAEFLKFAREVGWVGEDGQIKRSSQKDTDDLAIRAANDKEFSKKIDCLLTLMTEASKEHVELQGMVNVLNALDL